MAIGLATTHIPTILLLYGLVNSNTAR